MIIYGWNSFKIDGCKPSKLGLPEEMDAEYNIERRQKYFHLFWIPFFSIGKIWVLRKRADNQLYEGNSELNAYLESLPLKHKTPWYTYSLLILLLLVGLYFIVMDKMNGY